ncbi:MAG: SIR2 family protein [Bacteroidota bacterium]
MVQEWRAKVYADLKGVTEECPIVQMKQWLSENASEWYDENREYASLIERIYPLPTNRRKFIETEVAEKIPSIAYAYLVRLAEAGFLRTIFTTNFDDLLNEAFYQFSSERALVCAHDSSVHTISITSRRTKIIKLHGDYLFDDLKNTSKETQSLNENMKEKFEQFLKEYGLIIAGYSGSDKSITRILEDMSDKPIYLQNGLFWCFREEDEITKEALGILERPNSFYVLTPGFDELTADLYSILSTDATPFNSKLASDRASNKYYRNISSK